MEDFFERYERLCRQAKLNQSKISRITGIAYQTLIDHRRRKTPFSADECVKIAAALGVPVEFLITGKTEQPQEIQEAASILNQMSKEERIQVLTTIKALALYFKQNP